jgi:hypothetical protein
MLPPVNGRQTPNTVIVDGSDKVNTVQELDTISQMSRELP